MKLTLKPSRKHCRSSDDLVDPRNSKLSSPLELQPPRYYQSEANEAICNKLLENSKCLVKMFCGTGKSLVMATCDIHQEANLSLFVFPSLALIEQFYINYLLRVADSPDHIKCVSSDGGKSTTDPAEIAGFLTNPSIIGLRFVCVTYQSYDTLVQVMDQCGIVADVAMYDEAHHAVGKSYQTHIFHLGADPHVRKQVFFTATPKNANGIVMHDENNQDRNMCGPLAYEYSYFKALTEGYLNPFDIRVDFSTGEGTHNYYKSIARAILATGNNRVLTFHRDVTTGRDLSVIIFSDREAFVAAFEEVCRTEFPEKLGYYSLAKIRLKVLIGGNGKDRTTPEQRESILQALDTTPDNEICIVSSCRTIGEGIDTKRANMCVFVDPKTSYVDIIQNIGRILRKPEGKDTVSTVLLLCRVDRAKYEAVQDDPIARDAAIRHDVQDERGDFYAILNVLSALRQEAPELYTACMHYPNRFSPQEITHNLQHQGYQMIDSVDEQGDLLPNLGFLLGKEIDSDQYEDCEDDDERIQQIAKDNDVCVEVHTDSLDEPVKKFNVGCESGEVVRLFRKEPSDDEDGDDWEESATYQPIVKTDAAGKEPSKKSSRGDGELQAPKKKNRVNLNFHGDDDLMVLWRVCGGMDGLRDSICRAIEPEVVDNWAVKLEALKAFIEFHQRLPSRNAKDPEEKKLGIWLSTQKTHYKNKIHGMASPERQAIWEQFCEDYKEYLMVEEEKSLAN
jgi:superfamily II DNA or RNA helicase